MRIGKGRKLPEQSLCGAFPSTFVAAYEDDAPPLSKRPRRKMYGDPHAQQNGNGNPRGQQNGSRGDAVQLERLEPSQTVQTEKRPKHQNDPAEALAKELLSGSSSVPEMMNRSKPRQKVLTRLLSFLAMSHQRVLIMRVLDWVDLQPYLTSSRAFFYSKVMTYLSELDRPGDAVLQLQEQMQARNVTMDKFLYNSTISALGKAGQWSLCMATYREMLQAGFEADVYTYSSLIQACQCCNSRWKQATRLFEEMKDKGVKPNVITFTTLISCCQRAGKWRQAMQYFTEMEEAGVLPDLKAYNSLVSACARGARWEDAWDICSSMRRSDVQPSTRTYNALISACERAGEPARALEAYQRMLKESASGRRLKPTLTTINTLMSACAKSGMYDTVVDLYTALPRYQLTPDVFTLAALITVCKACAYWEEALSFAEEFSTEHGIELNTLACNALITTLGRAGRWQYALQVFERLAAGELDGSPDAWTHAALCLAFRRGEQFSAVLEVYTIMQEQQLPIYKDVFYAALEACERLGLWKEGQEVLRTIQATELKSEFGLGLDLAAWTAVFAFPPLMETVPKPIIAAARAAVSSGRYARRLVGQRRGYSSSDDEGEDMDVDSHQVPQQEETNAL